MFTTVTVLSAVLVGCAAPGQEEFGLLLHGEQAFRAGHYERSVDRLSRYLTSAGGAAHADRARYVRGMAQARLQRRASAYNDLQWAAGHADDTDVRWRSHAVLGIMHFEDSRWRTAARHLSAAAGLMPDGPPKDALLYRWGLSLERSGDWAASRRPYQLVITNFADGPYAKLTRRRLELRADHFAVQCGVFSQSRNARSMANELRTNGLDTHVRTELRGGTTRYVVLVGRYETYDVAIAALARVRGYVADAVLWP